MQIKTRALKSPGFFIAQTGFNTPSLVGAKRRFRPQGGVAVIPAKQTVSQFVIPAKTRATGREPESRNF
jgi:hypothetical protein